MTTPEKKIIAVYEVTKALDKTIRGEPIEFRRIKQFSKPFKWAELQSVPVISRAQWPKSVGPLPLKVPGHVADAILAFIDLQAVGAQRTNEGVISSPPSKLEIAMEVAATSEKQSDVAATDENANDEKEPDAIDDFNAHQSELNDIPDETEREEVQKSRIGQGKFRKELIEHWMGVCAVTGYSEQKILRASHIKPWRDCVTSRERLDRFNGLLLAPHFDALFDAGLISFDDSGRILLSKELSGDDQRLLGINGDLVLRSLDNRHKEYLRFHRENRLRPRPTA